MRWPLFVFAVALVGCPGDDAPNEAALIQQTQAPPTLTAELIDTDVVQEIRLSPGVAMAVTCWDYCADRIESCETATVSSSDPAVVEVHDVFRARSAPTFVLAAGERGVTQITLRTSCASQTYRTVVD